MIWAWWFGGVVLTTFLGLELWSIATGRPTLSATVYGYGKTYPFIPFLVGVAIGILAWHFWGICE